MKIRKFNESISLPFIDSNDFTVYVDYGDFMGFCIDAGVTDDDDLTNIVNDLEKVEITRRDISQYYGDKAQDMINHFFEVHKWINKFRIVFND